MMRRFRQQLPDNETKAILKTATNGVLSLVDVDGRPYGVPMSFVFDGKDSIYFHCATTGKKLECIKNSSSACFTVIESDEIHPEEFTTYYRSVIVDGDISLICNEEELVECLRLLSSKYSPGIDCEPEIAKAIGRVLILKLQITSVTGKEAIELTRRRH